MRYPTLFNSLLNLDNWDNLSSIPNSFEFNWQEEGDKFVTSFDLPGLKKEDIKVKVQNNSIFIEGTRKMKSPNDNYVRKYSYQTYVPKSLSLEDLEAEFEDGVLTLSCKKNLKNSDFKMISIK